MLTVIAAPKVAGACAACHGVKTDRLNKFLYDIFSTRRG
jgi:cytochrome c553